MSKASFNTGARAVRSVTAMALAAPLVITCSSAAMATQQNQVAEIGAISGVAQYGKNVLSVKTETLAIPVVKPANEVPSSAFGAIEATASSIKISPAEAPIEVVEPEVVETAVAATEVVAEQAVATESHQENLSQEVPTQEAEVSAVNSVVAGDSIMATAMNGIGVPYSWGGRTPAGWDCSGFVSWVFSQHGISLPHQSEAIAARGVRIPASEARPGDIVHYPGHVGIYAGNGMILDARTPASGTMLGPMWSANWSYYRITG